MSETTEDKSEKKVSWFFGKIWNVPERQKKSEKNDASILQSINPFVHYKRVFQVLLQMSSNKCYVILLLLGISFVFFKNAGEVNLLSLYLKSDPIRMNAIELGIFALLSSISKGIGEYIEENR